MTRFGEKEMLRFRNQLFSFITVLTALSLGACGDGVGVDNQTTVRVLLTDAPADYIEAAMVDIGAVELIGDDGTIFPLSENGTDGLVDLLSLQNAATMLLADEMIPEGSYTQLRLIVQEAHVVLKEPYVFNDGSHDMGLTVPSGAQTGIKLNLGAAGGGDDDGGLVIGADGTVIVLDFDVSQSFVIQGNPETPAGINGVLFTPTLRVVVLDDATGMISGTVTTMVDGVSVESLTVTAETVEDPPLEPFQTRIATATTDANGVYEIRFLVPGMYTVSVTPPTTPDGLVADPADMVVTVADPAGEVSGVDFTIIVEIVP